MSTAETHVETGQAVSLAFVAEELGGTWELEGVVVFLEGLVDLLWLAEGGVVAYEENYGYTYALTRRAIVISGLSYHVRRLRLDSPLEVVIEVAQHGAVYGVSAVALGASVLRVVNMFIETRTRWAASAAGVARSALEEEAYNLLRRELAVTPPPEPVRDPEVLEERIGMAARAMIQLNEARQIE